MFQYRNNNEYNVQLMPSYTLVSRGKRHYAANEEIAMYLEDEIEAELEVEDQTPITFEISPNVTKHYIVAFEKPKKLINFVERVQGFRCSVFRPEKGIS